MSDVPIEVEISEGVVSSVAIAVTAVDPVISNIVPFFIDYCYKTNLNTFHGKYKMINTT